MTNLELKKLEMFERFVDDRCELFGVRNTIAYLLDQGDFTRDDLLAMKFDDEDVSYVLANPDADYDCI